MIDDRRDKRKRDEEDKLPAGQASEDKNWEGGALVPSSSCATQKITGPGNPISSI